MAIGHSFLSVLGAGSGPLYSVLKQIFDAITKPIFYEAQVDDPDTHPTYAAVKRILQMADAQPTSTSAPVVTSATPKSLIADNRLQTLRIDGSNFSSGNVVQTRWFVGSGSNVWINLPRDINVSSNSITLEINPGSVPDTIEVRVCLSPTRTSANDCSAVKSITVVAAPPPPAAAPSISGVSPSSYTTSDNQPMTVTGANFVNGARLVFISPAGSEIGSTASKLTFVSSGQINYQFSASSAGTWKVKVVNPDNQQSGLISFTVR
jgi:hypothetical protein